MLYTYNHESCNKSICIKQVISHAPSFASSAVVHESWVGSHIFVNERCHAPFFWNELCHTSILWSWKSLFFYNVDTMVNRFTFNFHENEFIWVIGHVNESHWWMNRVSHERVIAQMKKSCHTWMSRLTHMNESCYTYEWVMLHIWIRHVTHMNESCHTYEWVKSHIWMSHVTRMNESCNTYECVVLHPSNYTSSVTWHTYTHTYTHWRPLEGKPRLPHT